MNAEEQHEPLLLDDDAHADTTAADATAGTGRSGFSSSMWKLALDYHRITTLAVCWFLREWGTAALTTAFSCMVAAIMPIRVQVVHRKRKKKGLLAALGGVASYPSMRLIADTGATVHAVGDHRLLCGLELYEAPEWVTLPNGTSLRILGIGHIELEHFSVPNVYLVEGFQKCLISISQLDRHHGMYSCFGRGIGRIMLTDGTQVGGAIRDENDGMYVLTYLEVPSRPAQE